MKTLIECIESIPGIAPRSINEFLYDCGVSKELLNDAPQNTKIIFMIGPGLYHTDGKSSSLFDIVWDDPNIKKKTTFYDFNHFAEEQMHLPVQYLKEKFEYILNILDKHLSMKHKPFIVLDNIECLGNEHRRYINEFVKRSNTGFGITNKRSLVLGFRDPIQASYAARLYRPLIFECQLIDELIA